MKPFTLAVAVAVVLTCISMQESSATSTEAPEPMTTDTPDVDPTMANSWMMLYNRHKRGIRCRFCCGCCTPGVCGFCCRF